MLRDSGYFAPKNARAALDIGKNTNSQYSRDVNSGSFIKHFKRIIDEETVPDNRKDFGKKHEKLRGIDSDKHLPNGVPRERFRSVASKPDYYVWAGKDIWGGVEGDKWDV